MTDRPIIFSAPMVRALLDGRKTMTRRLLNPQPRRFEVAPGEWCDIGLEHMEDEPWPRVRLGRVITCQQVRYKPGMKLWVREAWKPVPSSAYRCSDGVQQTINPQDADEAAVYRAGWARSSGGTPWKPSIHMPRWASRLTLSVTEVRAEALQDISEADALAEGVQAEEGGFSLDGNCSFFHPRAVGCFTSLWESLHGAGSWEANPEVAVISFDVAQRNIDA
jgi:hypothetical protein